MTAAPPAARGQPTGVEGTPRLPRHDREPVDADANPEEVIRLASYVHNDRLVEALGRQAFAALRASPGARGYYDQQRARGVGHHAALRQLGNRLVGILHGCLKTGTSYDEDTPWSHGQQRDEQAAA